ncbi:MAG: hypothetical protein AB7V20_09205 [Phycisphaerales bacterium]
MRPAHPHSLRSLALFANYVLMPCYATLILFMSFSTTTLLSPFTLWAPFYLLTALLSIAALWRRPLPAHTALRILSALCHAAILTHLITLLIPPPTDNPRGHITSILTLFGLLFISSLITIIAVALYKPRFAPPHCPICNYDLRGSSASACPECGTPTNIMIPNV